MTNPDVLVTLNTNRLELRSWMEAVQTEHGLCLVGMGSRTEYDADGKIVSHKVEPTGVVTIHEWMPKRNWLGRLFGV